MAMTRYRYIMQAAARSVLASCGDRAAAQTSLRAICLSRSFCLTIKRAASDFPSAGTPEPEQLHPHQHPKDEPLAFVNGWAEALGILATNLDNQQNLRKKYYAKLESPFAAQPEGSGKTSVGVNLTAVLRRPREADPAAEARIADALRKASSCWVGSFARAVDAALKDPRDENLLVRTLLAAYPSHAETILALKHADTLVVDMKRFPPREALGGLSFDTALAYCIYCAAKGLDVGSEASRQAFLAQRRSRQLVNTAVRDIMDERKGRPVLLMLDDAPSVARAELVAYYRFRDRHRGEDEDPTPKDRTRTALGWLSSCLDRLHSQEGLFTYTTGASPWLTGYTLSGGSLDWRLWVWPLVVHPMSADDILDALKQTKTTASTSGGGSDGIPLLDCMAVAPSMERYFAQRAQALTGGIACVVQALLRARQREVEAASSKPVQLLSSPQEVDDALEALRPRVPAAYLAVDWERAASAVASGELPKGFGDRKEQLGLLRQFSRMLLLDSPFRDDARYVKPGLWCVSGQAGSNVPIDTDAPVKYRDAAVALGMSFGPSQPLSSALPDSSSCTEVSLVAGEWYCRDLAKIAADNDDLAMLASAKLLLAVRSFGHGGASMRGRPLVALCAESLLYGSLSFSTSISDFSPWPVDEPPWLGRLLPHLRNTVCGCDVVPTIEVVALPTAVTTGASPLTAEAKAELLRYRTRWTGPATICEQDLPWLLSQWLPVGHLGVPAVDVDHEHAASQDLFLRLPSGIVGFAIKPASTTIDIDAVKRELARAPVMPRRVLYTLVMWSLNEEVAQDVKDSLALRLPTTVTSVKSHWAHTGADRWDEDLPGGALLLQSPSSRLMTGTPLTHVFPENGPPRAFEFLLANPSSGVKELLGRRDLIRRLAGAKGAEETHEVVQSVNWAAEFPAPRFR